MDTRPLIDRGAAGSKNFDVPFLSIALGLAWRSLAYAPTRRGTFFLSEPRDSALFPSKGLRVFTLIDLFLGDSHVPKL